MWSRNQEFEKLIERMKRASTAVEYEYQENDRRLTWFLVFQAFLFQAYATVLQSISQIPSGNIVISEYNHFFLWVICVVGILTAFFTSVSIITGVIAAIQTKEIEAKVESEAEEKHHFEPFGFWVHKRFMHWIGLLPTLTFPVLLFIAWLLLFVRAVCTHILTIWPFFQYMN